MLTLLAQNDVTRTRAEKTSYSEHIKSEIELHSIKWLSGNSYTSTGLNNKAFRGGL